MAFSKKESNISEKLMGVNIKALLIGGIWPNVPFHGKFEWLKKVHFFCGLFFTCLLAINIITETADIVATWGDLGNLANCGSPGLMYVACLLKLMNFYLHSQRFVGLVENLQSGYFSRSLNWDEERDNIVKRAHRQARTVTWIYNISTLGTVSCFLFISVFNSYGHVFGLRSIMEGNQTVKILPLKARFPFDEQKPGYFELAFVFQTFMLSWVPLVNTGMDTFVTSLIIHSCSQFKVLKYSVRNIGKRVDELLARNKRSSSNTQEIEKENKMEFNMTIYKCLTECIHHHQKLLEFVSELEQSMTMMMLGQIVCSSAVICLILFAIVVNLDGDSMQNLIYGQLLGTAVIQILLFCWFGNNLIYESDSLTKSIYEGPWYETSVQYKKSLCIMMARTVKLSHLTGGKLYVLSLDTFRAIIGASFSYYTVLSNVTNKQKKL